MHTAWAVHLREQLAYNPSGVPRRQALLRALAGLALGVLGGTLTGRRHPGGMHVRGAVGGACAGATAGAIGVMQLSTVMDRQLRAEDRLIGYSGAMRMLLHAGELSLLGAIGGGIGGSAGGLRAGMLRGALAGGLSGALLYQLRGLGTPLGLTAGTFSGAIGGAIGGWLDRS